ncbi:MAG TPA: SdpI family protein [Syntrophomonadaceae bacterium]|nr:SdpI family protein [Syntrophomonadaceae bacterium]
MDKNNDSAYHLNWKTLRREWPLWVLMAGLFITATLVYPHLPDQVPRHWNIHGQVNGYFSRFYGAFFAPTLVVALYLLLLFVPVLDPKRENYPRFLRSYTLIRWLLVLFMSLMWGATIVVSLGYQVDISLWVKAGVAILFTIMGNFMGQFRHNYFVGIRTPWTLASEEVWQRTHRLGGRIWVAGGLVCLAMAPFQGLWNAYIYFAAIACMTIIPIVYSYLTFARMRNGKTI